MRINPCFYCSAPVYPGHGIMFVRNDAREFTFCSSKCKCHFKARHNPRKSKWTKAHRKSSGKELHRDSVFTFEKRRNEPVRYNRDLYIKTVQAMAKIQNIKVMRGKRFYLQRMKSAQDKHMPHMERTMVINSNLINLVKVADKRRTEISQKTKNLVRKAVAATREEPME